MLWNLRNMSTNSFLAIPKPPQPATESAAPYNITHSCSDDPDDHASKLSKWQQTYDQLSPGRFSGELIECWFSELQIFREITRRSVQQLGGCWVGARSFLIPYAMDGMARWGHGSAEIMDMHGPVTLSGREEMDFRTPDYLDLLVISVDAEDLSRFSLETEGVDFEKALIGVGRLGCSRGKLHQLRTLLGSVFDMVQFQSELLGIPAVQKIVRQSLLTGLITTFDHRPPTQNHVPVSRRIASYARVVRKAKDYVLEHPYEAVTMADLCTVLSVSRRTLHTCFLEATGVTPLNYLRAVRLNHVRRELRSNGSGDKKVQDIAGKWGFWHMGHFSTDYKNLFGESPKETLRKSA